MSEEEQPSAADRVVEYVAAVMDALGLNGTRVRWKWKQRKIQMGEANLKSEIAWRSTQGQHKMCAHCRALVARDARTCSECGADLSAVKAPGVGRMLSNVLPGVSAATSLIMLVNGFWFALMMMAQIKSGNGGGGLFASFDLELIVRFGSGISEPRLLASGEVTGGEWWRLITPIFLHAGIIHFFFNSYLLLYLGRMVEEIFGTERFWVIYLACGIAGSMASQLTRYVITVGASGAIMGLMGLLLVYGLRSGGVLGQSMKSLALRLLLYTVVLSFLFGGGIDHRNHIGGLICGGLLALVVPARDFRGRWEGLVWQIASVGGVFLVLYAFYCVAAQAAVSPGT